MNALEIESSLYSLYLAIRNYERLGDRELIPDKGRRRRCARRRVVTRQPRPVRACTIPSVALHYTMYRLAPYMLRTYYT